MPAAVVMPKMEMSQETALVIEWIKKEGDWVTKGEDLLMVETDKVTVAVESPTSGILANVRVSAGDTVPVSSQIADIYPQGETPPTKEPARVQKPGVAATPLAARMAEDHQIDLHTLVGTGPSGRVTRQDIVAELASRPKTEEPGAPAGKVRATPAARRLASEREVQLNDITGSGPRGRIQAADVEKAVVSQPPAEPASIPLDDEIVAFEGIRRTIAERVQRSYQTAPHISFTSRVDLSRLNQLRETLNARAAERDEPAASLTAFLVKITAWALLRHPWINSSLRDEQILLHRHAHVGVAVALKGGLMVPVVHHADQKGIAQIASEIRDLTQRAHQSKLIPADVSGGTFTLSNLGPFGVDQFTAIINPGQTGILAVGAARPEPLVVDGAVLVRPVMHLTLSVDHRVVDGAAAALFIQDLCQALEQPGMLLW